MYQISKIQKFIINSSFYFMCLPYISCKSVHVFSDDDLLVLISKGQAIDSNILLWDGFFNDEMNYNRLFNESKNQSIIKAKEKGFAYIGNCFFQNGMTYLWDIMLDKNEEIKIYQSSDSSYFYSHLEGWGAYDIKKDTIEALYYRKFQNRFKLPRWDTKLVKYQGIIENDSAIANWRQVPPYPNTEPDQIDTIPRTLRFVKFPEVKFIDPTKSLFYKRFLKQRD